MMPLCKDPLDRFGFPVKNIRFFNGKKENCSTDPLRDYDESFKIETRRPVFTPRPADL
jgi:hypothetical protein